ncbi:MAG TPA: DUF1993 domain-containing protein [Acidobacteriaceae bacterium]|nr:DUF1993 domain-containing protein [Acidobacteriaceae bacterium]
MYDYTVPSLLRGLDVLRSYLGKMQEAIDEGRFTEKELLQARLAKDMLPLGRQFQIASANAKNGPARLTGQAAPWFKDDERTLADHRRRMERTTEYLLTLSPEDFKNSHTVMVDQSFRRVGTTMSGGDYLRALVLPNFYFHVAVAHAILRHKGLRLGKSDYLGVLPEADFHLDSASMRALPSEFLTRAESAKWLAGRGLQEDPIASQSGRNCFQFDLQPLSVKLSDLISGLMEDFGGFEDSLLLVTDWIWDNEYETDPTAVYREARNESRALDELPGFLFDAAASQGAVALLTLLVERKWTAWFYFASGTTALQITEGERVSAYTTLADAERLVRYRLLVSGNDVLPI